MDMQLQAASSAEGSLEPENDEVLMEQYREGDQAAFSELFHRYQRKLQNYAIRQTHNEHQAEDVVQETFIAVATKAGLFDSQQKFRTWLYRIAHNIAVDQHRKNGHRQSVSLDQLRTDNALHTILASSDVPADRKLEQAEAAETLHAYIRELPDRLKAAVELMYFEDLTYREAGVAADISPGTIKSRLHEAIGKLRHRMRKVTV